MDGFLVLLALVILAIPIAVIALIVGHYRLRARVSMLEGQVSDLKRELRGRSADSREPGTQLAPLAVPPVPAPAEVAGPAAPNRWAPGTPARPEPETGSPVEVLKQPEGSSDQGEAAPEPRPTPPARSAPEVPAGPIVLRPDSMAALGAWLQRNWIYVVSATSLALAGVFLVQYSVQNGFLPPEARVFAAYVFGAALVAGGEWLRRRGGDGEGRDTAHIPSAFAGAGIVTLFASSLAAEQLYGLIGGTTAFGLHLATAALAVVLGWFYGPLLVAFGLLGAAAAPFLISSQSGPSPFLYLFYGVIAATGLGVDAIRRWAWVSVLALVLAFGGGSLILAGGAGQGAWLAFLLALPLLSIGLPRLSLAPDHPAPSTFLALFTRGASGWPEFPVRLAAGTVLASALALAVFQAEGSAEDFLALGVLALLALSLLIWAEGAEGLADLALLPAAVLVLRLVLEGMGGGALAWDFWQQATDLRGPEVPAPLTLTLVLGMATLISVTFAYRALKGGSLSLVHGLAAVLVAPVAVAALEFTWQPTEVLEPMSWALHPLALAALMVALAGRFARADGADHRRMAYATLSALSLIALSLFILTSATALTLALAVLVAVAAWLDRRYDLREMGVFIQAAVAVLSWRLMIDPGVDWALEAPVAQVILAFAGPIAAYFAGLWLLRGRGRGVTSGVLESAALALAAVLANVLLTRALVPHQQLGHALDFAHVAALNAMPWLVLALAQTHRASLGPVLRRTRLALAAVAGAIAAGFLAMAVGPMNPLLSPSIHGLGALVTGPWLLDTLALAYALPALTLLAAAWRLSFPRALRILLLTSGSALALLYAGLEIRRFWRGDWLGIPGVSEPELYSYTIALMVLGAGLLWQAITRRSHLLRRIAMTVIALVIAKVFLIDAAGLTGLTRVLSFLGLGLSLAGLAFVNRWADRQLSRDLPPPV